jgi:hypothetical protein
MQSVLRERLLTQAFHLAAISGAYHAAGQDFVAAYIAWLSETEEALASLRSPLIVVLQAEKSLVTAVLDGYLPENIQNGKSLRKIQKAAAAQSMEKVSHEIYAKIEAIDHSLEVLSENLSQALAVLATKQPEAFKDLPVNQSGADFIWGLMGKIPETIAMWNYLGTKLDVTDRSYLMLDLLQKITSNRAAQ